MAGAPGCGVTGAACGAAAAGAFGSGVMNAQSGPGACAPRAESGNANAVSNTESRFMVNPPYVANMSAEAKDVRKRDHQANSESPDIQQSLGNDEVEPAQLRR